MTRPALAHAVAEDRSGAFVPGERFRVGPTAPGPLDGLTFAAKDLFDIAGRITGGGNPDWRSAHGPAARSAPAVAALLGAGATLIGKTVTDELAFSLEGDNVHYGAPVNPAAPDRFAGGSSSGSAVAVAAGLCDVALGTDTGGSVRVPASFCGAHGFRPSHGRIGAEGVIAFAPSFDTVGWFAATPEMLRRVGSVLLAGDRSAPIRRLTLASDVMSMVDPEVATGVSAAIAAWPIDGVLRLLDGEGAAILEAFRVLQGAEIWRSLGGWITAARPHFGPAIAARFADAAQIGAGEVAASQPFRDRLRLRMAQLLPPGTGAVMPTTPTVALRRSATVAEIASFYRRSLTMNAIASLAGLPQVTLPVARAGGLPVGVSIVAARGSDEALLDLACRLTAPFGAAESVP